MRGSDRTSGSLFSYVDLEERVPAKHPLRTIRAIVNDVLAALDAEFERLYEGTGRQSIAPERLLRASLLQAFYSVRSERQLMEQIDYNLLFRWFVGLGIDDAVWDHSTFSKNRDRLLDADVAAKFLEAVLRHPKVKRFLSDEHFSVDGTLVEAWAIAQELPRQGRLRRAALAGPQRRARLPRREARQRHARLDDRSRREALSQEQAMRRPSSASSGHALVENRHGLVVQADATHGDRQGRARRPPSSMIERHDPGSERRADARRRQGLRHLRASSAICSRMCVTPHVAAKIKGLGHRRPHDPARELRGEPAQTQADRGGVRLGQDHRRAGQGQSARAAARALPVHASRWPPTI